MLPHLLAAPFLQNVYLNTLPCPSTSCALVKPDQCFTAVALDEYDLVFASACDER